MLRRRQRARVANDRRTSVVWGSPWPFGAAEMTATRRIDHGPDALPLPRVERHEGIGTLPRHDDVRGATDESQARRIVDHAAEGGVNFIDTADVYADGRSEAIVGSAIKDKRDRWVLATKGAQQMGPNVTDMGLSRRHLDPCCRCQPEAPADRSHRSLLHPPRRPEYALGADDCHVRRADPPGQNPRMGAVERARLAHPCTSPTCAGKWACRNQPRCSLTTI